MFCQPQCQKYTPTQYSQILAIGFKNNDQTRENVEVVEMIYLC